MANCLFAHALRINALGCPRFDGIYPRMNQQTKIEIRHSHLSARLPVACALDIEVIVARLSAGARLSGRLYRRVVCAKVARYASVFITRAADVSAAPDRPKDPVSSRGCHGTRRSTKSPTVQCGRARVRASAVWPYYYAGTMGLVCATASIASRM